MEKRMLLMASQHPAAKRRVSGRSVVESLDGDRSEG
jgi:hypothetical protein